MHQLLFSGGGSHIGGGLLVSSSTLLECRVGSLCHCAKKCCTHQPKKCRLPRTTCCSKHPPNSSVLPAFILQKTVTSKANSRSRKFSISNPKLLPFETFLRFPVQTSNVLKIVAHLKTVHRSVHIPMSQRGIQAPSLPPRKDPRSSTQTRPTLLRAAAARRKSPSHIPF